MTAASALTGVAVLTPTADPLLVELVAREVDVVILDLEHGSIDDGAAATAVIVAHANGARIAARCATTEPARATRFLDAGGDGLIAARVDDAAAAAAWVAATTVPPLGYRGVGACRATGYGRGGNPPVPWLCVQIETVSALADLDGIAATTGVNALLVGERDLSYSLGVPGELADPRITTAQGRVAAAARGQGRDFVAVAGRLGPGGDAPPPDLIVIALNSVVEQGIRRAH